MSCVSAPLWRTEDSVHAGVLAEADITTTHTRRLDIEALDGLVRTGVTVEVSTASLDSIKELASRIYIQPPLLLLLVLFLPFCDAELVRATSPIYCHWVLHHQHHRLPVAKNTHPNSSCSIKIQESSIRSLHNDFSIVAENSALHRDCTEHGHTLGLLE